MFSMALYSDSLLLEFYKHNTMICNDKLNDTLYHDFY